MSVRVGRKTQMTHRAWEGETGAAELANASKLSM
jgi:hypothetical protein